MISIIILTKNEEADLPACLRSVEWCDDVHVLDSGSTDNTLTIAQKAGATIWSNPFASFGTQRNWALEFIQTRYEWVLFLDADEWSTPQFQAAVLEAVERADKQVAGFYCCWKLLLDGKWLKYSDNFPKWQFRLVRKGKASFIDVGHGQKEGLVNGKILYIKEPYLHFNFSKGWYYWIERHNKYSTQEAEERLYRCPPFGNIFSSHPSLRNPALKGWLSKLAIWPLIRFCQGYFLNLGFRDGGPGFVYSCMYMFQEYTVLLKMREMKRRANKPAANRASPLAAALTARGEAAS